jgi:hypothetical protein
MARQIPGWSRSVHGTAAEAPCGNEAALAPDRAFQPAGKEVVSSPQRYPLLEVVDALSAPSRVVGSEVRGVDQLEGCTTIGKAQTAFACGKFW